ncbi:MAG TPA: hypothetical protein ENK57_07050 [Polyangiaceae bacterium]|nr:hypothetical protein [Polyangiaceae bacterium]
MTDELELLKALPRHQPSDDLRREVRVAALDALASSEPQRWWQVVLDQVAIPMALAALSILCLAQAAAHTPLMR